MNGSTHGGRKVLARLVEDSVQSRNVLSSESSETRRVLPVLELSQVEIVAKFLKRLASLQSWQ
uniref:Uncharacterized protein n=1 Tax=Globisporangium ultimum (strain ATCC 200006 / CBS 805.95 / DAOM BR144) TaxID=431595 RepID=K3XA04_GLOUD